jgi:predicted CXXCH cytochrome family protein
MLFFDHAPSAQDHAPSRPPDDRFQIVNSVYRLRMSACFLKGGDALTCTTCHNPHSADEHDSSARYNGICRQCHASLSTQVTSHRHTASPDCIACHMPKRRTDDVVHAVMTDHYIQRRKPERDLLAEIPEPNGPGIIYHGPVVPYELSHVDPNLPGRTPLAQTRENELYLALAQVREDNNTQNGLAQFAAAIQNYRPAQAEFYIELADAFVKANQPANAIPLYKDALRRRPDSLAAALGLGDALEKSADEANAIEAFRASTKLDLADAGSWRRLGEAQIKIGRTGDAAVVATVVALQKSLELDPEVPETHYAIASLFAQTDEIARAEASYREAIRLKPDYSAAHMNLAILLSRGSRAGEARDHFETAIRYHPDYGLGHYNFGLMLIAQNRLEEARRQMELAVQYSSALDPKTREAAQQRLSELQNRR